MLKVDPAPTNTNQKVHIFTCHIWEIISDKQFCLTLSVSECTDLIDGLKESFARFRDNSESDFEQVMKLTEELLGPEGEGSQQDLQDMWSQLVCEKQQV